MKVLVALLVVVCLALTGLSIYLFERTIRADAVCTKVLSLLPRENLPDGHDPIRRLDTYLTERQEKISRFNRARGMRLRFELVPTDPDKLVDSR